jgi:secreted trypsin-like serine protease
MARKLITALFLSVAVSAVLAAVPASAAQRPAQPDIVGGSSATQVYPFMASMQSLSGSHRCGASLITSTWVVTARHCVAGVGSTSLQFRIGSTSRTSGGTLVRSRRIVQHPSSDLAVVQLAAAVSQQPITIASSAPVGSTTRLLGWGQTCPVRGCGGAPVTLRQLDTTILSDSQCGGIRGSTELCINDVGNSQGACYGDSGGPALLRSGTAFVLIGATSRGTSSTCAISPAIYVDVTAHRTWIANAIAS